MESLSLLELNKRIAALVMNPATQNVWVTAELSDVSVRGGHCYMELLQKDASTGSTVAKARAVIWANNFRIIRSDFYAATGQDFVSGLKVMVRLSVSMHQVYGMSMVINAVNPDYTLGDIIRRRNEMLERLKAEGIAEINKSLCWPEPPLRIAVVTSPEAAGYGDFMNQIESNSLRLRFILKLFPAIMQGDKAASSVIDALKAIESEADRWDGVVIIRGGGATSDLLGFDNYELAAKVASFPLPVLVGIGHERDVTVLDYVACTRVKTPTAAAEWLILQGKKALDRLSSIGSEICLTAMQFLSGCKEQLGQIEGRLPTLPSVALQRAEARLDRYASALHQSAFKRLQPQMGRLDTIESNMSQAIHNTIERRRVRLDSYAQLVGALSPLATLRRGYSITRFEGRAVTSKDTVPAGGVLVTTLADGTITSVKQ
ncbi:MAG: exodeoxyribonuclease VII large subunit [Muribaculum sp.]|nr:exodeoxyribonuclease VII large subunit [Muribaculum sp.]